uniref:Uncharacterized protein n=1 Tax=viral metagenome TaxID=1070528 RepID=A0A6C0H309_9ZZZZ
MNRDCFVCLNNTKNKVCTTCQCYAHLRCWGKYLKNFTKVTTYIYEKDILISIPLYAKCPQCSCDISNLKPVTRSDTRFGRRTFLLLRYQNMMELAGTIQDISKRYMIFRNMFELIAHNKNLIRCKVGGIKFKNTIKTKLIYLHVSGEWKFANLYHLKIFGKQIK